MGELCKVKLGSGASGLPLYGNQWLGDITIGIVDLYLFFELPSNCLFRLNLALDISYFPCHFTGNYYSRV